MTHATIPLRTAIFDPFLLSGVHQAEAFDLTKAAGASYVRLIVRWSTIAPQDPPAGFVASDPTSPGYSWSSVNDNVEAAEAAGLTPILDIVSPPAWATFAGKVTPKIPALGQFATALATHFDGTGSAPAERVFQIWNEPNRTLNLQSVSPRTYRNMVNAVATSVHAVAASNLVVAGDLDPFKNRANRFRTKAPLAWMRSLLCLSKGAHPHRTCKAKVQFDVWAHHPYTSRGPFGRARHVDDVSLGDLPTMRAVLKAGVRLHRIVSRRPIQFWVTEFAWDTNPPRPNAAPLQLEARWTAEAFYQMWRSGVSLVTWFVLQDQPSPSPWQCGLYFHSADLSKARAKPMRTSFRFPFVAYLGRKAVSIWGRDATSTKRIVRIQRRHGRHGTWRTVGRVRANRYGIFLGKLKIKNASKKDWLRAVAPGSGKSLAFSLTRPSSKLRYSPWGNYAGAAG